MNKTILVLAVIILTVFAFSGCNRGPAPADGTGDGTGDGTITPPVDNGGNGGTGGGTGDTGNVSQEDLDKLKSDLEGMEFEDLDALADD